MGTVGWREVCRKCGGDSAVEMTLAGDALSACSFCGLLERWLEPDGAVAKSGGMGCTTFALRDSKTVSPGMSKGALAEAWRRMAAGGSSSRYASRLGVVVVTRRHHSGRWAVRVRKGERLVGVCSGHRRHGQVIAALMVEGRWSEAIRERLTQKRLVHRMLGRRFSAVLGARPRVDRHGSRRGDGPGAEEEWDDLPL